MSAQLKSVWWLSSLNLGSCLDSFTVIKRCIYYQEVFKWHFHTILFLIQNRSFLEKHTITGTFKVLHQISLKSNVPNPTFSCWKSEEVFGLCNLAVQQSMWNYNVLSSILARSLGSASVLFSCAFQCLKALIISLSFWKDSFNLQPITVNQVYCFLVHKKCKVLNVSWVFSQTKQTCAVVHRFAHW